MRLRLEHNILQNSAKTQRIPDLWLPLLWEPNALGIAATFEIEHAIAAPAVLVVSDEPPFGIGWERGFTRTWETEEESCGSILANVRGTMHGENVTWRQYKIHHTEDRLLDFTGVFGATD